MKEESVKVKITLKSNKTTDVYKVTHKGRILVLSVNCDIHLAHPVQNEQLA